VRLLADTLKQVVLAPAAAIQFGNDGTFVYVLNGTRRSTSASSRSAPATASTP
jgi:hypothetical protein